MATAFYQETSTNPTVLSNIVMLCEGRSSDGKAYWAYLCMLPKQAEMFYQARKHGALDLEDYGTILEWGEGEHPSAGVADRMTQQFGASGDTEAALKRMIEQIGGTV